MVVGEGGEGDVAVRSNDGAQGEPEVSGTRVL